MNLNVPGQFCKLHFTTSSPDPLHEAPPCCGFGLSHIRDLQVRPEPQLAEHSLQSLQFPHPPSTGYKNINSCHVKVIQTIERMEEKNKQTEK